MSAPRFLWFEHVFSNCAVGAISVDLRRLSKNGVYLLTPRIAGQPPAPVDECERWMLDVLCEVIERLGKVARIAGQSGVAWELRPGQDAECLGPSKSAVAMRAAAMRAALQAEFLRLNDDDD